MKERGRLTDHLLELVEDRRELLLRRGYVVARREEVAGVQTVPRSRAQRLGDARQNVMYLWAVFPIVFPAPAVFSTSSRVSDLWVSSATVIALPIRFAESARSLAPADPG